MKVLSQNNGLAILVTMLSSGFQNSLRYSVLMFITFKSYQIGTCGNTHFGHSFFGLSIYISKNEPQANGKKAIVNVSSNLTFNQFQKLLKEYTMNAFLPFEKWEKYEYHGESSLTNLSMVFINKV